MYARFMASVTLTGMAICKRVKEAASIQSAGGAQKMCVTRYILNARIVQVRVRSLLCLNRVWVPHR